jgi:hypothetical protein
MLTTLLAALLSCALPQPHVPDGERPSRPPATPAPAPATAYFCPMKCEGDKTYADPSVRCPVCHMKLKPVPAAPATSTARASLTLTSPNAETLKPGETITLNFTATGSPQAITGTELAIAAADLRWVQHVPAAPDADGKLPVRSALPAPGPYLGILVTTGSTFRPTAVASFTLPGEAPKPAAFPAPGRPAEVGDGFELVPVATRLTPGKEGRLEFRLVRDGKPYPLTLPKANAMRVILLSEDLSQGVSLRPDTDQSGVPKFRVTLPAAGLYRALVLFEEAGQPRSGLCTVEAQ